MFDLPVKTKEERLRAGQYRNLLLDKGFGRIQLSVYVKYYINATGSTRDVGTLKQNIPPRGQVRMLYISDRQWSSTIHFEGPKRRKPEAPPDQLLLFT